MKKYMIMSPIETSKSYQTCCETYILLLLFVVISIFIPYSSAKEANMASTSVKYRNFVLEPILNRPVRDVPGIGPAIERLLNQSNIYMAEQLLGDYLKVIRNKEQYMSILERSYGIPTRYAREICTAMFEYSNNFLA